MEKNNFDWKKEIIKWKEPTKNNMPLLKDLRKAMIDKESTRDLDISDFIGKPYFEILDLIKKGYTKFYIAGSRNSMKSYLIGFVYIFFMLQDRYMSGVVIMNERTLNSDRTMRVFDTLFTRYIGRVWPEAINFWEKKDGASKKSWNLNMSGKQQEIRFLGAQDLHDGTLEPLKFNYWGLKWYEEISGSEERSGINEETQQKFIDGMNRFDGGISRFISDVILTRQENPNNNLPIPYGILEFHTFNLYNTDNLIYKNWVEKHDQQLEYEPATDGSDRTKFMQLVQEGYTYTVDETTKSVYMTTNFILALKHQVLTNESFKFLWDMFENNPALFWTDGLGRGGHQLDSVYGNIWSSIDSYQGEPLIKSSYVGFSIHIDVGIGNAPTHMTLFGLKPQKKDNGETFYAIETLEGISLNKGIKQVHYEPKKITEFLVAKIYDWVNEYPNILQFHKDKPLDIIMDNDPHFKAIFMDTQLEFIKTHPHLRNFHNFNVRLHKEKYLKVFINAMRPQIIEPLLANGIVKIFKDRDPITYKQFKSHSYEKQKWVKYGIKKIKDVKMDNDDGRQTTEMMIMHNIHFLIKQLDKNYKLNPFIEDILKIK